MNISKKITSFAAFAVLAAGPVIAQPTLVGTFLGETPEGNNAFLFELNSTSTGSYAVELGFEADFVNSVVSGNDPANLTAALAQEQSRIDLFNQFGIDTGFRLEEDTYYYDANFVTANKGNNPFTGTETTGWVQEPTTLFMSFGSDNGTSSPFSVLRVVTTSDSVAFSGIVAQDGVNNQVSGVAAVPEPTTAALLGLGGLALMARKRRQA